MPRALVVAAVLFLLPTAPAAAQSYDSSFRFGLGLDYGGLFGRNDGAGGGLRLQLGARVHENLAVYYQGQGFVAGFARGDEGSVVVASWNAVLAELNVGIFQLGAGPSFDVTAGCGVGSDQSTSDCFAGIAPGLATRAALRFGMFTLSVDLHASFHDDDIGTMVWGLMGIGMQLGDVPREPMRFAATDRTNGRSTEPIPEEEESEPADELSEFESGYAELGPPPNHSAIERATLVGDGSWGLALDNPYDPSAVTMPEEALLETAIETEAETAPPERAAAPVVRRFTPTDVSTRADRPAAPRGAADQEPRRRTAPRVEGSLEFEGSDDPLEGLGGL